MKAHIIGITGPSNSGKSELARRLVQALPGTDVVSLDSYYRRLDHLPAEERRRVNFDHPDSLDSELLHEHLQAIATGSSFEEPVYDFAVHNRAPGSRHIQPAEFLIVEGIFVFYWPELRAMLHTKVCVDADLDVCLDRRLRRDVAERGRTPESVRDQYEATVRPSSQQFILPYMQYADVVVSGEQPLERSTAAVLNALRRAATVPS
jgi:uridine kinase